MWDVQDFFEITCLIDSARFYIVLALTSAVLNSLWTEVGILLKYKYAYAEYNTRVQKVQVHVPGGMKCMHTVDGTGCAVLVLEVRCGA